MLTQEIEVFLRRFSKKNLETPLIIGGDFNSMPNSGVYTLLSGGFLPKNHKEMLNRAAFSDFRHSLKLKSAYSVIGEFSTNYTPSFTQ